MMVRRPSKRASAESWHRDEAVSCLAHDQVFGGWINFDPYPQALSAVPRSHVGVTGHGGFAKLSAAEAAVANAHKRKLQVPAGHLLVFNEKLMHEVCPAAPPTKTHTILRLFTGWRLTTASEPQHGQRALEAWLAQQAVCRLKSGQGPKMWANMSWSQPKQRAVLEAWSVATFRSQCLHTRTVLKKKAVATKAARGGDSEALAAVGEAGERVSAPLLSLSSSLPLESAAVASPATAAPEQEVRTMVHQQMESLESYGLPLYRAYSAMERQLLYPRRSWTVQIPGQEEVRQLELH